MLHPPSGWQWRPQHSWLLHRAALPTWRTDRSGNTGNCGNRHTGQKTHSGDHAAVHTLCSHSSVSIVEECVSHSSNSTCHKRGKYQIIMVYWHFLNSWTVQKLKQRWNKHFTIKTSQLPPPLTQRIPSKKHSANTWVSFDKQRCIPGNICQHEVLSEEMHGLPHGGPVSLLLFWLKGSLHQHQVTDLGSDGEHQHGVQNDRQVTTGWLHLTP